jgi:hypothetical protein
MREEFEKLGKNTKCNTTKNKFNLKKNQTSWVSCKYCKEP